MLTDFCLLPATVARELAFVAPMNRVEVVALKPVLVLHVRKPRRTVDRTCSLPLTARRCLTVRDPGFTVYSLSSRLTQKGRVNFTASLVYLEAHEM